MPNTGLVEHATNLSFYLTKSFFNFVRIRINLAGHLQQMAKMPSPGFIGGHSQKIEHILDDFKAKSVQQDLPLIAAPPHQPFSSFLHSSNTNIMVVRLHQDASEEAALFGSHNFGWIVGSIILQAIKYDMDTSSGSNVDLWRRPPRHQNAFLPSTPFRKSVLVSQPRCAPTSPNTRAGCSATFALPLDSDWSARRFAFARPVTFDHWTIFEECLRLMAELPSLHHQPNRSICLTGENGEIQSGQTTRSPHPHGRDPQGSPQSVSSREASAPGFTRWQWREVAHYQPQAGCPCHVQMDIAVGFTLRRFSESSAITRKAGFPHRRPTR